MMKVVFRDESGQPVAGAVMAITSAPAEQTDIGYQTDDEGVVRLSIATPGDYGFTLTAGDGRRFTASAPLPVEGEIDVTAHAVA